MQTIPSLETISPSGFRFAYSVDKRNTRRHFHTFCGRSSSAPLCPNCSLAFQRFAIIDFSDPVLKGCKVTVKQIQLLFCWRCFLSQEPFFYRFDSDGNVVLLSYGVGPPELDFPYENYPEVFPEAALTLIKLHEGMTLLQDDYVQARLTEDGTLESTLGDEVVSFIERPRHQLGGYPFLYSYVPHLCPMCDEPMAFLATICDKCTDVRGFVGNDYVQVVFSICDPCGVLCARQECD